MEMRLDIWDKTKIKIRFLSISRIYSRSFLGNMNLLAMLFAKPMVLNFIYFGIFIEFLLLEKYPIIIGVTNLFCFSLKKVQQTNSNC